MLPIAILCGGLATRLGPITETVPKSLVPIAGEPFLAHQLRLLRESGFAEAVLCVGHLGHLIQDYVRDGSRFGMRITYSFDGDVPLGTAGALRKAAPLLGEAAFVLYGDSYLTCDYRAIERAFVQSGTSGLMTVYRNDGLFDTSNVEFARGKILCYQKRTQTRSMHHIDYGLGVLRTLVFTEETGDLADTYSKLLADGELAGYEVAERFYEIGSVAGMHDTEQFIQTRGAMRVGAL
ncbi:MAG TPA: sugar phosphate nucleotidyltransferase [Bryobacteraceae bacterium]|jgi:NDP-sugar pyrophosphorylase family protein|nr:sugar phosphate nucleotidyltransferase [Bryobacteraceae bacterium]